MSRSGAARLLAAVVCMLAAGGGVAAGQTGGGETGKLAVTVEYKGAGTVSKEHRIWLWVFDSPEIATDSDPIAYGVLTENGGTYRFAGLPKEVYVAGAFDTQGGYDGTAATPPPGTPVFVHGGKPVMSGGNMGNTKPANTASSAAADRFIGAPVATGGDEAALVVTFDDTVRLP